LNKAAARQLPCPARSSFSPTSDASAETKAETLLRATDRADNGPRFAE